MEPAKLTLITLSPLSSFTLSPPEFFDAREDGLTLSAQFVPDVPQTNSHIHRFIRTPEGYGVAVERMDGSEIWSVYGQGTKLTRCGSWRKEDIVVVMDEGMFHLLPFYNGGINSLIRSHVRNVFICRRPTHTALEPAMHPRGP